MSRETPIGSGLSEQELQFASWWVRHAIILRKIGYVSLILFSGICWLYAAWIVIDTYLISAPREERIPAVIASNSITSQTLIDAAPQPLSASPSQIFETTGNRRDYLVQLSNPNPLWWAEFVYYFDTTGGATPDRKGFILPTTQSYLTEIGATAGRDPQFRMKDIQWHRVYPDVVGGNYAAYTEKRLKIRTEDVVYSRDISFDGKIVGQSSFTLVNASAYGYWNIGLTVLLYRQNDLAGITTIALQELKPGERRPMAIHWFENLDNITRTDVVPSVNILDPTVFLPSTRF